MNSINNGWDSIKRAEMPYFHCGPSGQNEKKQQKNNNNYKKKDKRINKSKENTLIYMHMYVCMYVCMYVYIYIYIYIYNTLT